MREIRSSGFVRGGYGAIRIPTATSIVVKASRNQNQKFKIKNPGTPGLRIAGTERKLALQ